MKQAVRCCRRCRVAGGERVPPAPVGWYSTYNADVRSENTDGKIQKTNHGIFYQLSNYFHFLSLIYLCYSLLWPLLTPCNPCSPPKKGILATFDKCAFYRGLTHRWTEGFASFWVPSIFFRIPLILSPHGSI